MALLLGSAPAALARYAALLLGFALVAALELTPTAALLRLALRAELMMSGLAGRLTKAAFKAGLVYNIPVLGREEDAADQMAGFILSQFGPEVARRTLPGAAYVWQQFNESRGGEWPHWLYSDEHGHDLQRSYNYLCMAYGSDPTTFAYYVDSGLLPKERAVNCKREADQMLNAFQKTMLPHIDAAKMKAVQDKKWLPAVVGL